MTQFIIFHPKSQEAHWLVAMRINSQKRRVSVCFDKIERLYAKSKKGDVIAILELYQWYQAIRQVEGFFDKEIKRLGKLVKRKVKERIEYVPYKLESYRLKVTTPISVSLYQCINKFDILMCLSKTCLTLSIMKKRRVFFGVTKRYQASILQLINHISHYKYHSTHVSPLVLTTQQKSTLRMALQSDVMPMLPVSISHALMRLVNDGDAMGSVISTDRSHEMNKAVMRLT